MLDSKSIEQIFTNLRRALPNALPTDLEKNLRAGLSTALNKLDLVTREELEVQSAVLARTRARLEALEKQVAALEHSTPK